jgi:flagellar biogenesis protein FliO
MNPTTGGRETALGQGDLPARAAKWFVSMLHSIKVRRAERTLRLCESLPLGEKRFLAVVQCDRERFLIGVSNQSISMLRQLDGEPEMTAGAMRDKSPDAEGGYQ